MLFPHHCFACGEVIVPRQQMCERCRETMPYILPPLCPCCGRNEETCVCRGRRRHFERCVSPFYYEESAKQGISYLKNRGYRVTVEGFASHMAELVRREYGGIPFDYVTGVPLHVKEHRERGFDQSALLAKSLAKHVGVPYLPLLYKCIHTRPQKELTALERSGNLLGAFDVKDPDAVQGKTLLLVDDVITTGATLDECAKMLKIYGVEEVYAITAVAAVLKKDGE